MTANTDTIKTEEELQIQKAFDTLLEEYKKSGHRQDIALVEKAFHFSNQAHKGIKRRSGEPYILHPIAVATIAVKEIGLGTTSICSALLHDVVEDTDYTVEDIENLFGTKIARIVDGLTKISGGVFGEKASEQAENFRKLLLTISEDIRVIMIKIADRLHNMRTLSSMPPAKQYKIAGETVYIYAPLAYRLGLFKIKTELENLSFKYEHPDIYKQLATKLELGETEREIIYNKFITPIQQKLQQMNYEFTFEKRVKSVFSIWHKMQTKNIPFEEIFDLLALRIIFKPLPGLDEKEQCWMIYSAVTNFYRPHPERIRDWISTPKANGYESLHVTVMGPQGHWVEVQIRSERMHDIAERGLAAHWKYKTGGDDDESELDKWLKTIKELLENPEPSAIDFLDTFKLNLFATEIFVFTPKGDIRTLPQGATALDFAFSLHSDLGMQCIGAKVNHKLVPLSHPLSSGDQVEILTSQKQKPQSEWLNFVTTARAKTKIKSVFKKEIKADIQKGQQMLENALATIEVPLNSATMQSLLNYYKIQQKQDLYNKISKGEIKLIDFDKIFKQKQGNRFINYWKLQFGKTDKKKQTSQETLNNLQKVDRRQTIKLTDENKGELYKIAECCNPIPGDDVLGFIDDNEVIILHKRQCPNALKLKSNFGEKIVSAEWTTKKILSFRAVIEIKGIDAIGVLSQIVKVISQDYSVNIRKVDIESKDGIFEGRIHVYVYDTQDINNLCMNILKIKAVNSVKRIEE